VHFSGYVHYLKISVQPLLRFLRRPRYRKINKDRRAFLWSWRGERFRIKRIAAPFSCLSFITEFVEVSFDAAPGFQFWKWAPRP
jgi:hypothetical protein